MKDLLEIDDLTADELGQIMDLARDSGRPAVLAGEGVALVFEKPSARTRNSMEMAVAQLGGHPVTIRPDEVGIDSRESAEDIARTLACYHAMLCARVFEHEKLERMAAAVDVPVINLLSDEGHPVQALADVLTMHEVFGSDLTGRCVAYVGDANNVARSLALACAGVGAAVRVAAPAGYGFSEKDLKRIRAAGAKLELTEDPVEAVSGADVVYTDVWASMGQEAEAERRRSDFAGFTVDEEMLSRASGEAVLLHCLPAHRGEEVSAGAMEGPHSRVWLQAENRMHAARGLIRWMMRQR